MKKTLIFTALTTAFALPAFAESYTDSAPVVSVRPVTERIPVDREECWSEQRRGYEERRVTRQDNGSPIGAGTVIGAIAGGVIGHQFGQSSGGRGRGTAAGALVGGPGGDQGDRGQRRLGPGGGAVGVQRRPPARRDERRRTVAD